MTLRLALPALTLLLVAPALALPWGVQTKHGPHRLDGSEVAETLVDVTVACRVYDAIDGKWRYEAVVVPAGSYVVQPVEFFGATTVPATTQKRSPWGPNGRLRRGG